MISVAIISPERSLEPISKVIESHDFGCKFHKYIYNELSDIDWIYSDCKDTCDVMFFSGELGYHYIYSHISNINIPCSFTAYGTKDILSILLDFSIKHPNIPLERVFVDFLTPQNDFMDIFRYIEPKHMPKVYKDTIYDYEHITARTREYWDSGQIDIVITRCINNLKVLDQLCIPYLAVFPTEFMIQESIEAALNQLRLTRVESADQLVVILRLLYDSNSKAGEREYREVTMHKLLVDFRRQYDIEFSIMMGFGRFEMYMKSLDHQDTTQHLQALVRYLKRQYSLPFRLGAGLHHSKEKSHFYAETALQEALKFGGNDGFLVSGENSALTGPLSAAHIVTYSYTNEHAIAFARHSGISESNLLKLVGLFQLDSNSDLTAASIGKLLNITPRSANRILQQLLEAKLILETAVPLPQKKGRPIRHYRFSEQQVRSVLL